MALQAAFLSYALGGSDRYDGNGNMTSAHQRLVREYNLRMEHFDLVLQHLGLPQKAGHPRGEPQRHTKLCPCTNYNSGP